MVQGLEYPRSSRSVVDIYGRMCLDCQGTFLPSPFECTFRSPLSSPPPPPAKSVMSVSEMLDSRESVSRSPKRQRESFTTPEMSDDEERRMHASFLLNLASPEANTREPTVCATSSPPPDMTRKKHKSRYADTISQPLVHLIRPPYEFMNGSVTHRDGSSYRYGVPQSPPQSPPEVNQPRQRARPYRPCC
jgi:hypothetical protein